MTNLRYLHETIGTEAFNLGIAKPKISEYILNNLKHSFFEWQEKAFVNFLTFQAVKEKKNPNHYTHLMFNMATGTGKTLLMAAAILYYFKEKGYRHFLFFVNQNNIIDKTENNFIDSTHTKYLFKERIVIDNQTINVKKVDIFSDNPQGIEIKFTSIQKLYNDIHVERENQTTLDDLNSKDIVMLADEAHHLNANTSKKGGIQQELDGLEMTGRTKIIEVERKGWEHTVIELILKKKRSQLDENNNVLLEFTATIPEHDEVKKKYADKIIYQFGLKDFFQKGYTKEINLISSTLNKKERVFQALLFQWYRGIMALKYEIPNFKSVILFRSKTIDESWEDYEEFLKWIADISRQDFNFLTDIVDKVYDTKTLELYEMGKSRTIQILDFIEKRERGYNEIVDWIKYNFSERNVVITNSGNKKSQSEKTTEEQEKLLNSLEDKNNHIRAIFTVDRLTEGWDVLNLFDIVRLYQGQNAGGKDKKTPKATVKEKQLIGRGVRYFPFTHKDMLVNKRKFDSDLGHDLRVLEELYYYTYDEESRYISHLKKELRKDGMIAEKDDKIVKTFSLKDEFIEGYFYKNAKVFYNKKEPNPNRKKKDLEIIKKDFEFEYKLPRTEIKEEILDLISDRILDKMKFHEGSGKRIIKKIKDIEKHIFQKAINILAKKTNSLYQFENLKEELDIDSIDKLQANILADFEIKIVVPHRTKYENINSSWKLKIVIRFLEKLEFELKEMINPEIGSDFISGSFKKLLGESKTKTVSKGKNNMPLEAELKTAEWYILDSFNGSNEEAGLINFIRDSYIAKFREECSQYYLFRNEEIYKIYDFETAKGFQPDFILFLVSREKKQHNAPAKHYQIFIEPKGEQFLGEYETFDGGKESWKLKFLEEISRRYGLDNIIKAENSEYRLIGLPFFSSENNEEKKKFETKLDRVMEDIEEYNHGSN